MQLKHTFWTALCLTLLGCGADPVANAERSPTIESDDRVQQSELSHAGLTLSSGVLREPIGQRPVSSAYFHIQNRSETERTLIKVSSPIARAIEIHETVRSDGQMQMRRHDSMTIPALGSLEFKSGGKHLMVFGIELNGAKEAPFSLEFADGQVMEATFAIERF